MSVADWEIDEETGLPRLPEGHFWRIQDYDWGQDVFTWQARTGQVSIWENRPPGVWSEWIDSDRAVSPGEHDIEWQEVPDEDRRPHGREKQRMKQQVRFRMPARETLVHSSTQRADERDPVHELNLRNRCIEVYADWQQSIEREKIYGDYPPKRLGNND